MTFVGRRRYTIYQNGKPKWHETPNPRHDIERNLIFGIPCHHDNPLTIEDACQRIQDAYGKQELERQKTNKSRPVRIRADRR